MTQDAKPLTPEQVEVVRRHAGCTEYVCDRSKPLECEAADEYRGLKYLLATIDQQATEIGRLSGGVDWLSRLIAGYIKYDGENAPLAYFNDTAFPGELANILAEAREAHEEVKTHTQPCPNAEPCAEHPRVPPLPADDDRALRLARRFHDIYEELAPQFGYETRTETRKFNAESANGRLMISVCRMILHEFVDVAAKDAQ